MIIESFSYFSSKPYVVTLHLNLLVETVMMRGHSICLCAEQKLSLIITKNSLLSRPLNELWKYNITSAE